MRLRLPHCCPTPTAKQRVGLQLPYLRELLYGGAAGGGKSDYLLMAALQFVDQPGYRALIMRRTFPQLSASEGLLQRAQEWLTGYAKGVDTIGGLPTRWAFPSGATLDFRHCQYDKDRFEYQGAAYHYIGFDELTQFSEKVYRYLFSRCRKKEGDPVPLRVRSASNPGGAGHDWVKARFLSGRVEGQAFLPARLEDNPHLDQDAYAANLDNLMEYERRQLRYGDWDVRPPGSLFNRENFNVLDVPPSMVKVVRRWDCAASEDEGQDPDYTVGVRMGRTAERRYVVCDVQRARRGPGGVERMVRHTAEVDGPAVLVRMEQEPGSSGKASIATFSKVLNGYQFRGIPSTGDKVVRAKGFAAQVEHGNVDLVRGPWVEPYLAELEMFPGAGHDDQVDGSSGAHADLSSKGMGPAELYGEAA